MKDPKAPPARARRTWLTLVLLGLLLLSSAGAGAFFAPAPAPVPVSQWTAAAPEGWLPPVALRGVEPDRIVRLPGFQEPLVVHVWLQGCADCAPAFEAARRHHEAGVTFGARVVNVAFGRADLEFARAHGLTDGLAIDPGSAVVQPLGIGTFTTVVLDQNGWVRHMDYPQQDGYVERVRAAVAEAAATPRERPLALTERTKPPTRVRDAGVTAHDVAVGSAAALGLSLVLLGLGWGALLVPWAALLRPAPRAPGRVLGQEAGVQERQRCPYCHADVGEWDWVVRCEGCATVYHEECAGDLGRCSSLGCARPVSARRGRDRA